MIQYETRRCDKCGTELRKARIANGTLFTQPCVCGGKLVPVEITQDDVDEAVREAVAAERERCAKIAESYDVLPRTAPDFVHQQGRAAAAADIAKAIREGNQP